MMRYELPFTALIALAAGACQPTTSRRPEPDVAAQRRAAGALGGPAAAPRLRALALGDQHACALRGDGRVLCWGLNDAFQVGDVEDQVVPAPRLVEGIVGATDIAAGARATCAVLGSGELRCWGFHAWRAPHPVPLPGKALHVALGSDSIVVEVENSPGISDLYGGTMQTVDHLFAFSSGSRPRQIESIFLCGVVTQGQTSAPTCWTGDHRIEAPEGATGVDEDSCFVGPRGRACPREDTIAFDGFSDTPPLWRRHFEVRPPIVAVSHRRDRDEEVACGGQPDGRIECDGVPDEGQLGDGRLHEPTAPALVPGLADVVQIRVNTDVVYRDQPLACARTRGGAAFCWIIGESAPVQLPVSDVVDLTLNLVRVVALRRDGSVVEIPFEVRGSSFLTSAPEAAIKGPLAKRRYVALVDDRVPGAVTSDGALVQIHCPASTTSCASAFDMKSVRARTAGWNMDYFFACAIDERGAVQCRTNDTEVGILGDGRVNARGAWDSPKKLRFTSADGTPALPGPAAQLALAQSHVCARTQAGELRCWGDDIEGAVGDGGVRSLKSLRGDPTRARATPVAPAGLGKVIDVAVTLNATCAVDADAAVWCWGQTSVIPATASGQSPIRLALPRAVSVAVSKAAVCIVTDKGEVVCQRGRPPGRPKPRRSAFTLPG
jgi:Regulator of chromosome condensation (RCC1) repeat